MRRLLFVVAPGLTATLVLTGCAADNEEPGEAATASHTAQSTTPPSSPTVSQTTAGPTLQAIAVTIADGTVTPAPDRIEVDAGTTVRIQVTSDEHDEIHVHGYDLSAEVDAGGTATLEFETDQTGLFEVESHELGVPLFQLQVQ